MDKTTNNFLNYFRNVLAITAVIIFNPAAPVRADEALLQPEITIVDESLSETQRKALSDAARRYYTFWHTGDPALAKAALGEDFIDLNLPSGRPQGPNGPLKASQQFRTAVPDLTMTVEEMLMVGDRVIGRLHFKGHFTGSFQGKQGAGQAINFTAVDMYRIKNGEIVENWHLEDNLTLLQQMGLVAQ